MPGSLDPELEIAAAKEADAEFALADARNTLNGFVALDRQAQQMLVQTKNHAAVVSAARFAFEQRVKKAEFNLGLARASLDALSASISGQNGHIY